MAERTGSRLVRPHPSTTGVPPDSEAAQIASVARRRLRQTGNSLLRDPERARQSGAQVEAIVADVLLELRERRPW